MTGRLRVAAAIIIFACFPARSLFGFRGTPEKTEYAKARVISVETKKSSGFVTIKKVSLLTLSGKFKGRNIETENYLWDDDAYNTHLRGGRPVAVQINSLGGKIETVQIKGYYRQNAVMLFLGLFFLLLIAATGRKAIGIMVSMAANAAGMVFILLPLIWKGANPAAAALGFCLFSMAVTLLLITGPGRKTLSAAAAVFLSLLFTVLLAAVFQRMAHITGYLAEGSRLISVLTRASGMKMNFFLLGTAAVLVTSLGMAMDVAVSLASFIEELASEAPGISFRGLYRRGISVGSDMLSTMVNSLIFVFLGISLPLFLVTRLCGITALRFINFEFISQIAVQSLLASSALILTIPLTCAVSAFLAKRRRFVS